MALLDVEFLLLLDQLLQRLEILSFDPEFLVHQSLADVDPLLDDRDQSPRAWRWLPPMVARSASFCACWRVERRELGTVFGHLADQELRAASPPAPGSASSGGTEVGQRIVARRPAPRAVAASSSCVGHEVALQMVALGGVHRRIELDQHVARLDRLAVLTWIARTTPVSNGWMTLVRPLGTILPVAEATMSIVPQDAQASASAEEHAIDGRDRAADRRRRRLDDLERRRQERELFAASVARSRNGTTRRVGAAGDDEF